MSGVTDGSQIHGALDGIATDAQGLQEVSDTQASLMHSLANTCEALAPALQGQAGTTMQQVGEQLHQQGMVFSTTFADHSAKMGNNGQIMDAADSDGSHILMQVSNLVV